MPIINGARVQKKEKMKAEISSETFSKIKEYCAWADIDVNLFIEEAASFIFAKDRDWKQYKKAAKKRAAAEAE